MYITYAITYHSLFILQFFLPPTIIKTLIQMPHQWLYSPLLKYVTIIGYIIKMLGNSVADPEGGTGGTCPPPLLFLNSLSHSYIQP